MDKTAWRDGTARWRGTGPEPEPVPEPEPTALDPDLESDPEAPSSPPDPDPAPSAPTGSADAQAAPPVELVLEGPGIDPTGASVSTAAVVAWFAAVPAGSTVIVRGGDVIAVDATIRIDRRVHLRGRGELRFVGGVEAAPALKLIVAGSSVTGIRVGYAGPTPSSTGERNTGISIWASDVLIDGVTVDGFQNGIAVQPSGEFEGVVISACHVLNIVGSGGGRGSTSSAGEDRGDGITVWGARSAVVGNIVSAAPGTDARVGIHAENLPDFAVDPGSWADSMVTIEGNVVTGPFRRSIAVEGMAHTVVTGNTVSDATWWGLAVIDTRSVALVANTVRWTRTADDDHGSAWRPKRCPVMLYRDAQGTVVSGNLIEIRGVAAAGIMAQAAPPPRGSDTIISAVDALITDNVVRIAGGTCPIGIALDRTRQPVVSGNRVAVTLASGSVGGVVSYLTEDAVVSGNSVTGAATSNGFGVLHQGAGSIVVTGNRIDRIRVAVAVSNCTGGATIIGNTARECEYGLDTFGTTGHSVVQGNRWESNNTAHANAQPNTSYLSTRHMGLARPYGGRSGDILIGNGRLWVNDQGTWRSTTIS
ncbi:NosD domain-containing protein [Plantibacter sp. ME-Dv--P-122b]|uniref:NosD domain-containing protein n=1 Tax=Plantibacter sp. ME-Dv--P-122b TaxID=3040300 RepID=UPI00254AB039|nr:NosD domain-containing protein [Plantibacter sp. ME-Dv--P-122b]